MRWVYSLCLVTLASAVSADDHGTRASEQTLLQTQQCRFEIILGRVVLRSGSPAKGQHRQSNEHREESLAVSSQRTGPSLHYVRNTHSDSVLLDVYDGNQMRLQWRGRSADVSAFLVVQPADGPITVEILRDKQTERLSAPSLWHLRAGSRAVFESHLQPLFAELGIVPHGGWSLSEVEQQLRDAVGTESGSLNHQQFRMLVGQLGHASRALRNEAQRRLQQEGVTVLPLIDALQEDDLSGEQRARLDRVRRNLVPVDGDRSERLAQWLASDVGYWSSLVGDWKTVERVAADRYLRQRLGQGLPSEVLDSAVRIADGSAAAIQR